MLGELEIAGKARPQSFREPGAGHGRQPTHGDTLSERRLRRRISHLDLVARTDGDVAIHDDMGMQTLGGPFDLDGAGSLEAVTPKGRQKVHRWPPETEKR